MLCRRRPCIERVDKVAHRQAVCQGSIHPCGLGMDVHTPDQVGKVRDDMDHSPDTRHGQHSQANVRVPCKNSPSQPRTPAGDQGVIRNTRDGYHVSNEGDIPLGSPQNSTHLRHRQSRGSLGGRVQNRVVPRRTTKGRGRVKQLLDSSAALKNGHEVETRADAHPRVFRQPESGPYTLQPRPLGND